MNTYLEHANITVPDIDAAIKFLLTLEPDFTVRHDESPKDSRRWAHVGSERTYIALQEPSVDAEPKQGRDTYVNYGVNHLGWVVDDIEQAGSRLQRAGYRKGMPGEAHAFRKRAYYYDAAGFEWELVEYLSTSVTERNAYYKS